MSIEDHLYNNGFHVIDNFLEQQHYLELQALIQHLEDKELFKPAKIGQQHDKTQNATIRNDRILWLDEQKNHPAVDMYLTKLKQLSEQLNQSLFLGLMDYEAHFAIYQPNNFYKKHVDQFTATQERRISCVYYLNHEWQQAFGGELRLYDTNDHPLSTITPQGNRFVCFNSDIPHEVLTAYKTRYSITAWLKVRPIHLRIN